MKTSVTVVFPVTVEVEVDEKRLNDDDYIESIREKAFDDASDILDTSSIKPCIQDSDISELLN